MTTRSHFYRPIRGADGQLLAGCVVRVLNPGSTAPIPFSMYNSATGSDVRPNPFDCPSGLIDLYVEAPCTVRLGVTPPDAAETFIDNIEIGVDSDEITLTSPDGTRWQVIVDDAGCLTTTART
jgi:hypothetical protein